MTDRAPHRTPYVNQSRQLEEMTTTAQGLQLQTLQLMSMVAYLVKATGPVSLTTDLLPPPSSLGIDIHHQPSHNRARIDLTYIEESS